MREEGIPLGQVTELDVVVRSTEIDINGHVNNAKYLEYLEWGREDWYEQCGLDYGTLYKLGAITVVAHISIDFRREARQNEHLRVYTWLNSVGRTSLRLRQVIQNVQQQPVIEAEVVVVTIDPQTRRPTPVPEAFRVQVTPQPVLPGQQPEQSPTEQR
ncbi:MAG: acyl-CoA thioesterase [Alicyclobacillus sp.]|nr:acyl-CoA thioesterase [Alicyclobacillus sp.]